MNTAPWCEKYRPSQLEDLVGNVECVGRLIIYRDNKMVPNLILTGVSGSGKTSAIGCMAVAITENHPENILELNASSERGIDTVRKRVREFTQRKTSTPKFVILDEVDNMTASAQHALRHTMESCSATTRFAMSCNDIAPIIPQLQSACIVLRFARIAEPEIARQLGTICVKEGIKHTKTALKVISASAQGDMRYAINLLQGFATKQSRITASCIKHQCGDPVEKVLDKLLLRICHHDLTAPDTAADLVDQGYFATDLMFGLLTALRMARVPSPIKVTMIPIFAKYLLRVASGISPELQMRALISELVSVSAPATNK